MFEIIWDGHAVAQANQFLDFEGEWDYFLEHSAAELAKYAEDYFKPMLKGVRTSPKGNGDTERSIKHDIAMNGDGFEITYTGLLSALYLDKGNFPASSVIMRANKKPFPVDQRFGSPIPSMTIHGMGSYTSGLPLHWSDETVKHMSEDDVALEIAEKWLNVFLDEVVIKA